LSEKYFEQFSFTSLEKIIGDGRECLDLDQILGMGRLYISLNKKFVTPMIPPKDMGKSTILKRK
jgi:hypothetical protein